MTPTDKMAFQVASSVMDGYSRPKKRQLFDDTATSDADAQREHASKQFACGDAERSSDGFVINRTYATRYENWRRNEELQKFKDKYGDEQRKHGRGNKGDDDDDEDESSSSDDSDDDAAALRDTKEDINFFRALSLVKKKDPRVYSEAFRIFAAEQKSDDDDGNVMSKDNSAGSTTNAAGDQSDGRSKTSKRDKKRPLTLADYEVKVAVERGGQLDDEDDDVDANGRRLREFDTDDDIRNRFAYDVEQRAVKQAFLAAIDDDNAVKSGADTTGDGGLLSRRTKTVEEQREDDHAHRLWLQGKRAEVGTDEAARGTESDLKFLRDYWNDPKLGDDERFLRDYILNQRYLDNDADADDNDDKQHAAVNISLPQKQEPRVFQPLVEETMVAEDEERKELERLEEFEQKYNFRFEEPDPDFIKRYPRTIGDSLRASKPNANTRKTQRESARERKQRLLQQRREEIRQYKNLVKHDIVEKIEKLKRIAGNDDLDLKFEDLEADFDPTEYDRKMQQLFGNDYYEDEEAEKPVLSDESDVESDWDQHELPSHQHDTRNSSRAAAAENGTETAEAAELHATNKKPKRKSKFAQALEQPGRPAYDPKSGKTFEEYFNEYYKLDCEDVIVNGQLPCRFHYQKVKPNSFGLTPEEILLAPERELNSWVSLKRVVAKRDKHEEDRDVKLFQQMATSAFKKKKILPSLFETAEEADENKPDHNDESANGNDAATASNVDADGENGDAEAVTDQYAVIDVESAPEAEHVRAEEKPDETVAILTETERSRKKRRRRAKKASVDDASTSAAPTEAGASTALLEKKSPVADKTETNNSQQHAATGTGKRRRKRNKRNKLMDGPSSRSNDVGSSSNQNGGQRQHNHRRQQQPTAAMQQHPVFKLSDERLKAYGLNPKKLRNRIQYGGE